MGGIMIRTLTLGLLVALTLTGCSTGDKIMKQPPVTACEDSPNCVSSKDTRPKFALSPFTLTSESVRFDDIVNTIASLSGATLISQQDSYAHFTFTTPVLRFVDDVEISVHGTELTLRSASRIGYYDFGANRRRADAIRQALRDSKLITPSP
ncbi:hypothetical protein BZG82_05745 [Salinivibrio sp. PR5]|nr:hypothetical protein BZG82_05745 [Salinivibrio sp. PR5]